MGQDFIINQLKDKRILILGFGREGKSSYQFIRKHLPTIPLVIADENPHIETYLFENDCYTKHILYKKDSETFANYDIVLKSPGISLKDILGNIDASKISSQTDLFLQAFAPQCIGITGTKGKSTTASFIYHILNYLKKDTLLAGNIGIPLFDIAEDITPNTKIVLELSSHQLEFIRKSPHISILLNLFEEHLDHYNSLSNYYWAKFNIARRQSEGDYFIYNVTDISIANLLEISIIKSYFIGFSLFDNPKAMFYTKNQYFYRNAEKICEITSDFPLKGEHNLINTTAVIAAIACMKDIDISQIKNAIYSFRGLPHRLEFIGEFNGVLFYNDSISTIPQASIAAVKALKKVNTILLGGMDRGIDYVLLVDFLKKSEVENLIFTGDAGKKIMNLLGKIEKKQFFFSNSYQEMVEIAKKCTKKGCICLLSPAAASYDQFKNFEHRGDTFRQLVLQNE